jgi:inner membrane protein
MEQFFPISGHWVWWVAAGLLLIGELLAPGVFLIWLAAAAALTGLADLLIGLTWQAELIVFAVLALVSVYAGRSLYRGRVMKPSDNPHLNRRQQGYVGRSFKLKEPIVDGRGKLAIDDTIWEIEGPDLPAGSHIEVAAVNDMRLVVAESKSR